MKKLWKDYNLSIVLFAMFIVAWIGQTYAGWVRFASEQREQGNAPEAFGPEGYVWEWSAATLENWQSEFLQLFTMVVLTAWLIHRGSAESRDSSDRMEMALERIERKLQDLSPPETSAKPNKVAAGGRTA